MAKLSARGRSVTCRYSKCSHTGADLIPGMISRVSYLALMTDGRILAKEKCLWPSPYGSYKTGGDWKQRAKIVTPPEEWRRIADAYALRRGYAPCPGPSHSCPACRAGEGGGP